MKQGGEVSDYFLRQVPHTAAGCVHSVFRTSFNVEVGGFLAHIGAAPASLSCLGIRIPEDRMRELLALAEPGGVAAFRGGLLRIYGRDGVGVIPYGEYAMRSLKIENRPPKQLGALRDLLTAAGLPEQIGLSWDAGLCDALKKLADPKSGENAMREAILFLLGRGMGLTPSGDDILLGFGAALTAWGEEQTMQRFAPPVREALAAGRTTDVSAAYLRAMLDRQVNEDYLALFGAVGETAAAGGSHSGAASLRAAVDRIAGYGHTSGWDGLLGVLTAVRRAGIQRGSAPG